MCKGDYIHKEYPKTCRPDDFWGQVKRTVHGKPVSQDQIDMIIYAIRNGLSLSHEDILNLRVFSWGVYNFYNRANLTFQILRKFLKVDPTTILTDFTDWLPLCERTADQC